MQEKISQWQYTAMVIGFVIGTSALIFVGGPAGRDAWIAISTGVLEGMVLCVPFLLLCRRFEGIGISGINDIVWGKYIGKFFTLAFIWYTLSLCSKVTTNYQDFIKLVLLNGIPDYALDVPNAIFMAVAIIYGIEVMGRAVTFFLPFSIGFIFLITFLAIPYIDPNEIRPILHTPLPILLSTMHTVATFPVAETIAFSAIIPFLQTPQKALRTTFVGITAGAFVLLVLCVRNLGVLNDAVGFFSYPTFTTARVINIAGFFSRMEIFSSINLIYLGLVKAVVLLFAASITAKEMLNLKSIRTVVIPFVIFISVVNHHNFESTAQNVEYAIKVYPIYALPFQVIFPLMTLIGAIILKKKASMQPKQARLET